MSFHYNFGIPSLTTRSSTTVQRTSEETLPNKTAQSTVIYVYQVIIAGYWRNVTVSWCRNLMHHTLYISVESIGGESNQYTCKIDVKPWNFWSKKGYKTIEVDGNQVEVYWDLRSPKFSGSPEPCSDYYVALASDEEIVLLLGDYKKKAYKRTKSRPALVDAVLYYKKENVFAKKSFGTRAKFDDKKESDIVVESSISGPKDPEMWISIDGIVLIHVRNLQWKFRGNQTVMVNTLPVQVFWDVHDWLFSSPGTGHGLFIFKTGPSEAGSEKEGSGHGGHESDDSSGYYSAISNDYQSTRSNVTNEFCLFLYAWKLE
ncbi:DUF868 family protein [Quillaja saponaria]|uniref:DUF868 family protein n=1 Tax=Quillaja saponaria TaxID=32244 RepID=A0AAD7LNG6_QUISA|nr:DUF868 family protein [Quillaja saponaria]